MVGDLQVRSPGNEKNFSGTEEICLIVTCNYRKKFRELGPLMEIIHGKFLLPPPPPESGRLVEVTQNLPGGIGRVVPPQTKILATPLKLASM